MRSTFSVFHCLLVFFSAYVSLQLTSIWRHNFVDSKTCYTPCQFIWSAAHVATQVMPRLRKVRATASQCDNSSSPEGYLARYGSTIAVKSIYVDPGEGSTIHWRSSTMTSSPHGHMHSPMRTDSRNIEISFERCDSRTTTHELLLIPSRPVWSSKIHRPTDAYVALHLEKRRRWEKSKN